MYLSEEAIRFAEQFSTITRNPEYMKLMTVPRHGSTNTYDHSIRVAMMAYSLASALGQDPESAARIGLLHDFCLVDYHKDDKEVHNGRWYCFYHPEDAVENSLRQGFQLNPRERRAILTHMFPLSTRIPTSLLACLLTLSDKTVAAQESLANVTEAGEHLGFLLNAARLKSVRILRRYTGFFNSPEH